MLVFNLNFLKTSLLTIEAARVQKESQRKKINVVSLPMAFLKVSLFFAGVMEVFTCRSRRCTTPREQKGNGTYLRLPPTNTINIGGEEEAIFKHCYALMELALRREP